MPSDSLLKLVNRAHRTLLQVTGGRVGASAKGMPVIQLTTVGRRSGEERSVMLTCPIHEDGTYVVVGSRGGDDQHPAWFLNLQAESKVGVTVGGQRRPMVARVATGADRTELWSRVTSAYPHYGGYQEKTDRELPLVVLSPA